MPPKKKNLTLPTDNNIINSVSNPSQLSNNSIIPSSAIKNKKIVAVVRTQPKKKSKNEESDDEDISDSSDNSDEEPSETDKTEETTQTDDKSDSESESDNKSDKSDKSESTDADSSDDSEDEEAEQENSKKKDNADSEAEAETDNESDTKSEIAKSTAGDVSDNEEDLAEYDDVLDDVETTTEVIRKSKIENSANIYTSNATRTYIKIAPDKQTTSDRISQFEVVELISTRISQIALNGLSTIEKPKNATIRDIAISELSQRRCPLKIIREVGQPFYDTVIGKEFQFIEEIDPNKSTFSIIV